MKGRITAAHPLAEMMGKEFAEPMAPQADAHESLDDVHVWIAVALDQDRSVLEDRDVPAHHHAVGECMVRLHRELLGLFPIRQNAAFDLLARVRMD